MAKFKLSGTARIEYTRVIDIPEDEVADFLASCEVDDGTIEVNLEPVVPGICNDIEWEDLDFERMP